MGFIALIIRFWPALCYALAMDEKLTSTLNRFAAKIMMLECEIVALRGLLNKRRSVTNEEFVAAMDAVVDQYTKDLTREQQTDAEKLDEFLRKFEGPPQ
jgi:hypothetical protein